MTEYLAFLRAVNVGRRRVNMGRLREVLTELGLEDAGTYINSGNAYFRAGREPRAKLQARIEAALEAELGFEVETPVRTLKEVEAIVARDPFAGVTVTEDTRCCVVFGAAKLPALSLPVSSAKGDVELIEIVGGDAFAVFHQLPGKPANSGPFLEKTLGVPSTTRFFHTLVKITAAARKGLG
jgi:uncharacterized protein (DUF1697 family)